MEFKRYVVYNIDETKILTQCGFKYVDKLNLCNIKLFNTPTIIKAYFENHKTYRKLKYVVKKVIVNYEVEQNES